MATIKEKIATAWLDIEDETPPTGFLLAPLSKYDAIDFRNEITVGKRGKVTLTGEGIRIAGNAVRDWRNVTDAKGEAVKFSREAYDELDIKYLVKVADAVFRRNFLSEIERKN